MKFFTTLFCAMLAIPVAGAASEFVLQLPLGAKSTYSQIEHRLPALVPVGPYKDGSVEKVTAPDVIRRSVWSVGVEQTVQAVQAGILEQLERSGYETLFSCVTRQCGGFDFRFGIDVVDEPMMRVDLRNFRFISAKQTVNDNPAYVTFLMSRTPVAVFVQMTEYSPKLANQDVAVEQVTTAAQTTGNAAPQGAFSMVLEGLIFETGSTALGADPETSIKKLADVLVVEPDATVMLVGHSDMSGSLDGNIAISKARANSVRDVLITEFGIAADRVSAYGVGFLVPRADNATEDGRQKNRRVEAVFSR